VTAQEIEEKRMNNLHNKTAKLESNIIDLKIKETTEIKLEKERV